MDRYHAREDLLRTLAMLAPGSAGLSREEAMALACERQASIVRRRPFRDRLAVVLADEADPHRGCSP
jgi:hypothetical protein